MNHQRWIGRAAERCLDATSSVVCVGVGVCPKMHHQRWVGRAAERCLDATSSVGGGGDAPPAEPPAPGRPSLCVGRGPTQ